MSPLRSIIDTASWTWRRAIVASPEQGGHVGTPGEGHGDRAQIAQGSVDLLGGIEGGARSGPVARPPQRVSSLAERVNRCRRCHVAR
jgi:hypothetical protein